MKLLTGTVIKASTPKTVYVEVESLWMHPIYRKNKKSTKVFPCHDTIGVKVGDTVVIAESKPMSATKRFVISEVKE